MNEDKLSGDKLDFLPCPFCGGTAAMDVYNAMGMHEEFTVYCTKCRARGPYTDKSDLRAASDWNTRKGSSE